MLKGKLCNFLVFKNHKLSKLVFFFGTEHACKIVINVKALLTMFDSVLDFNNSDNFVFLQVTGHFAVNTASNFWCCYT
jgi:hypothetical protein